MNEEHENQNIYQEIPNQPGENLRQRIRDPPVEVRPPNIARNQQAEILFWKVCCAIECAILITVIIITVLYCNSLDFENISLKIAVSTCEKQLERFLENSEDEKQHCKEKMEKELEKEQMHWKDKMEGKENELRSCQESLEYEKQDCKEKTEKELEKEQKHFKEKMEWKESELKSCQKSLEEGKTDCKEKIEKELANERKYSKEKIEGKQKELERCDMSLKAEQKKLEKQLESCDKRYENEREYSKEKVEDIHKQSEESSFVKSDLGEYKTSYNITWTVLVLTWIGIVVCVCCNVLMVHNETITIGKQPQLALKKD